MMSLIKMFQCTSNMIRKYIKVRRLITTKILRIFRIFNFKIIYFTIAFKRLKCIVKLTSKICVLCY